jgi:DNA topoisomerase-3
VQLVIAEKPAVARDLARVLGIAPVGAHCFEGRDRVITWCVGHLVELEEPAAYDARWRAWRLDTLPMMPPELRLRPARHAAPQLRAVVRLLRDRRFTSVVNACDAGREGELIFRYLYRYAGGGPPILRLWVSALTDEAIRRGLASLRPGAQLEALADAARARSEADWLVGMNLTRAVTTRGRAAGHTALYSIGRVQTPTLAMLVAREQAIRAFTPRPYWEVQGRFRTAAGAELKAGWRHGATSRLGAAALAEAVCARDRQAGDAAVERVHARTVREPPPLLFDLTALQRTANRRYGLSAARTLEIAQALYERHKVITYPRTDSRHLASDHRSELAGALAALAAVPAYAAFAERAAAAGGASRLGRRFIDDAKVSDHHAIIPTAQPPRPGALDRDEDRVLDLIARRFLGAFFPDAEIAVTEVWIRAGAHALGGADAPLPAPEPEPGRGAEAAGEAAAGVREAPILEALPPPPDRYFVRGRTRVAAGWQEVAGIGAADSGSDGAERGAAGAGAVPALPALAPGDRLEGAYAVVARHTTPPPRLTEAALLGAMESAGGGVEDEELRRALRDCGLGTPATRAAVIETLLDRGYAARALGALTPTALGIALIEALPVASLTSAELTGRWEARLARIARGHESRAAFMADIARYVQDAVDAVRAWDPPAPPPGAAGGSGARPRGGAGGRSGGRRSRGARAAAATGARRAAGRGSGRRRGGAAAAAGAIGSRRDRGRRADPRPAAMAGGPAARASVEGGASRAPARAPADGVDHAAAVAGLGCPRCGQGTLIAGARGWGCSRWRAGCGLVIWFRTAGRAITAAQLRDLVARGRTRPARFISDDGQLSTGRLVLDPSAEGGAARFEAVHARGPR